MPDRALSPAASLRRAARWYVVNPSEELASRNLRHFPTFRADAFAKATWSRQSGKELRCGDSGDLCLRDIGTRGNKYPFRCKLFTYAPPDRCGPRKAPGRAWLHGPALPPERTRLGQRPPADPAPRSSLQRREPLPRARPRLHPRHAALHQGRARLEPAHSRMRGPVINKFL